MSLLKINNLQVSVDNNNILNGINLILEKGKIYALEGPNGSGKSTLAEAISGNPRYIIEDGKIIFDGKNITNLPPDERAKKGLFLSFQNPKELEGIKISSFLRTIYNSANKEKISILDFQRLLEKKAKDLGINENLLSRYINEGFSGGEKKKFEALQLLILNPKLLILDEIDSGLDEESLKKIAINIKNSMDKNKSILIITHHKKIFEYLKPDKIFVMKNGELIKEGGNKLVEEPEKTGYENIK